MVDINNSKLFQKKKNNPLDKIRQENNYNYKTSQSQNIDNTTKESKKDIEDYQKLRNIKNNRKNKKGKNKRGAPVIHKDPIFKSSKSIKVSAYLEITTRALLDKFMTTKTKDIILREALNEYIITRLTTEDRRVLLDSVMRDVELYRQNNPFDINEGDIQTEYDLNNKFIQEVRNDWKIEN